MNVYDRLQNEDGEGYIDYAKRHPAQPTTAEQEAIIAKHHAEATAKFAAEWTADVTASRRAAWNAEATKPGFNPSAAQKKLGFTLSDLKRAVAMHA